VHFDRKEIITNYFKVLLNNEVIFNHHFPPCQGGKDHKGEHRPSQKILRWVVPDSCNHLKQGMDQAQDLEKENLQPIRSGHYLVSSFAAVGG